MKTSKKVFAAMFAIGLGSSCAYAQTATLATTTAATATFTAVVAQVDWAAGKISLTQILPAKPSAVQDSPTATADYLASATLLNSATVGATVSATVQLVNGNPTVIALQAPSATDSSTPTSSVSNDARLTPSGSF